MIDRDWEEKLTIIGDEAYMPGERIPKRRRRRQPKIIPVRDLSDVERERAEKLERKRATNREYMRRKRASDPEYRERERLANRARDRSRQWGRERSFSDDELMDAIDYHEERLARLVNERRRRRQSA